MAKAKMTKTQLKRGYLAIKQKARRLWDSPGWDARREAMRHTMSTQDMLAIEKICDKYLKKF